MLGQGWPTLSMESQTIACMVVGDGDTRSELNVLLYM